MFEFVLVFFFFKQKTAYEMRISDWSSDVCSSDLRTGFQHRMLRRGDGYPPAYHRQADHPESARDGRGGDAEHLRRPDRIFREASAEPRSRSDFAAHPQ